MDYNFRNRWILRLRRLQGIFGYRDLVVQQFRCRLRTGTDTGNTIERQQRNWKYGFRFSMRFVWSFLQGRDNRLDAATYAINLTGLVGEPNAIKQ